MKLDETELHLEQNQLHYKVNLQWMRSLTVQAPRVLDDNSFC